MTQQDNWNQDLARLTQRQDQLERQYMDSTRNVEALRRDADALKRDVDRRLDSLRGETDRQIRDGERRVSSLERSRDTAQNLFWYSIPLVTAVAMIIILVIAVVASREQRRELGEPEQRSPSSIEAPLAGSGGHSQAGFIVAGTPFRQHHRYPGNQTFRSREPDTVNPPPVKNRQRLNISPVGSTMSLLRFDTCSVTWPAAPA